MRRRRPPSCSTCQVRAPTDHLLMRPPLRHRALITLFACNAQGRCGGGSNGRAMHFTSSGGWMPNHRRCCEGTTSRTSSVRG